MSLEEMSKRVSHLQTTVQQLLKAQSQATDLMADLQTQLSNIAGSLSNFQQRQSTQKDVKADTATTPETEAGSAVPESIQSSPQIKAEWRTKSTKLGQHLSDKRNWESLKECFATQEKKEALKKLIDEVDEDVDAVWQLSTSTGPDENNGFSEQRNQVQSTLKLFKDCVHKTTQSDFSSVQSFTRRDSDGHIVNENRNFDARANFGSVFSGSSTQNVTYGKDGMKVTNQGHGSRKDTAQGRETKKLAEEAHKALLEFRSSAYNF